MHCLICAQKYNFPSVGELTLARCSCCGEYRGCYNGRVNDLKLLLEPRDAIKNRIKTINARLEKLQPLVDKYNALFTEKTRLREKYLALEHKLTRVQVVKVKAQAPTYTSPTKAKAKRALRALSTADKQLLIAMLERDVGHAND